MAPSTATAAEMEGVAQAGYIDATAAKFGRGFANATTGWLELPKVVLHESRRRSWLYGCSLGLLKGVAQSVGRTVVGAVELGTFFVPTPELIHPRFV